MVTSQKKLATTKAWQKANPEKHKAHQKKSSEKMHRAWPEKYLWTLAQTRAKRRGIEFTISVEDIQIPEYCPVLDFKLGPILANLKDRWQSPTLDRIDNDKGYILGNIAVISFRGNSYKRNLSIQQIKNLYALISSVT